jgi:hypothetical protein
MPRRPHRAVAVDGKTLRGSGHPNPQVHLLAAMDHTTGGILGQSDVDHTTNEVARFRPLLDRLDSPIAWSPPTRSTHNVSTPSGWSPPSTPLAC